MSSFTNYMENAILNHIFGGPTYTPPAGIHLALFTVAPSDSGGGQEVTTGGYTRKSLTFDTVTDGSVSNSNLITYLASGGDFGTVVATGLYDAASGGNLLMWTPITPATINEDDTLSFVVGSITASLD